MKVNKKYIKESSIDEFWYQLREGYIEVDKICKNKEDALKVKEAVEILKELDDAIMEVMEEE